MITGFYSTRDSMFILLYVNGRRTLYILCIIHQFGGHLKVMAKQLKLHRSWVRIQAKLKAFGWAPPVATFILHRYDGYFIYTNASVIININNSLIVHLLHPQPKNINQSKSQGQGLGSFLCTDLKLNISRKIPLRPFLLNEHLPFPLPASLQLMILSTATKLAGKHLEEAIESCAVLSANEKCREIVKFASGKTFNNYLFTAITRKPKGRFCNMREEWILNQV